MAEAIVNLETGRERGRIRRRSRNETKHTGDYRRA